MVMEVRELVELPEHTKAKAALNIEMPVMASSYWMKRLMVVQRMMGCLMGGVEEPIPGRQVLIPDVEGLILELRGHYSLV